MRPIRLFLNTAYGLWAVFAFVVVTVPTLLLLTVTPGRTRRRALTRAGARLIFTLTGQRPRVTGAGRLPDEPCVVAANHASYVDGILLTAVLPPRFTFVIKKEMTRVPLAHYLLRRIGSEFVDRANRHRGALDFRRILDQAHRDESLVFFPEGTFTHQRGLRRFHPGAFATAARGRVPLVPIIIRGTRDMLPADRWLPRPSRLSVEILPAIPAPANISGARGLMHECRQAILSGLAEPDLADIDAAGQPGPDGWRRLSGDA